MAKKRLKTWWLLPPQAKKANDAGRNMNIPAAERGDTVSILTALLWLDKWPKTTKNVKSWDLSHKWQAKQLKSG